MKGAQPAEEEEGLGGGEEEEGEEERTGWPVGAASLLIANQKCCSHAWPTRMLLWFLGVGWEVAGMFWRRRMQEWPSVLLLEVGRCHFCWDLML